MRSKVLIRFALASVVAGGALFAQDLPLSRESVSVSFPADSPVTPIGMTTGESRATARGSAIVLDLHLALTLRNSSGNRIHALTLLVKAQEITVGGKGRVSLAGLNVGPGESFPLRIDTRLIRPAQIAGPLVDVSLDGVLFQDLSFYGPDRENTRRTLTAWELEAQRDRDFFNRVLRQNGKEGLRQEIVASLARQHNMPQLEWRVPRGGGVTAAALGPERQEQFAFLQIPDSPITPVSGSAAVAGNEVRAPNIEIRNRSSKPIKYVELGWLVQDQAGHQYLAASVPAGGPDVFLPANQSTRILQDKALDLSLNGQPLKIRSMTGFVSQVQFADGKVWVPSRQTLEDPVLQKALPPSNEEQRLTDIYRKNGLEGLIAELKKF